MVLHHQFDHVSASIMVSGRSVAGFDQGSEKRSQLDVCRNGNSKAKSGPSLILIY
jgi:hypothetical protein